MFHECHKQFSSAKAVLPRTTVSSRLADISLLRTGAKSSAETTKKRMGKTPAIVDSRYYRITDTSRGLKATFLLFYSRYNGHPGRIK